MRRWVLSAVLGLFACEDEPPTEPGREPCAQRSELKDVFFGDLHVHTGLSYDAWVFDVKTSVDDAYRFAQGDPVGIPPLDAEGKPSQMVQLDRPLDFMAVTDHSEFLAEVEICSVPGSEGYDSSTCQKLRRADDDAIISLGGALTAEQPVRFADVCGSDPSRCAGLAKTVWQRVQAAAEAHYDRSSACTFTSFIGYEYTGQTSASNLHRNVIFRNERVPDAPASYFEFPRPSQLWDVLDRTCKSAGDGCDVLAIPHNPNWSNGNLFAVEQTGSMEEQKARSALRGTLEPVMEIFQHKGDSECMSQMLGGVVGEPDELCDFEKLRPPPVDDCGDGTGFGAQGGFGCVSRLDFYRGILLEGLKEEQRIGNNPYRLGAIGSTDSHNATGGFVEESRYLGHWGGNEDLATERLGRGTYTPGGVIFNPGGLAAVWAEENSRSAIFDALLRREVYGTSGPRIVVRMFGAAELDAGLCDDPRMIEKVSEAGVPMGGLLFDGARSERAPSFLISAMQDPGSSSRPGTPLAAIQMIKGWIDSAGTSHVEVFDVAGALDNGSSVDLATCRPDSRGTSSLCTVWTDPSFDASQPAYYYARVLEDPVCRWSWTECLKLQEGDRPESCADEAIPKVIRERAWTSPIWYGVKPVD